LKLLPIIAIIFLIFSQFVWAGGPTITYTAPSFTFNSDACSIGSEAITANISEKQLGISNLSIIHGSIRCWNVV